MNTYPTGEYTGPQMEIEWHRAMLAYLEGGKQSTNPILLLELKSGDNWISVSQERAPSFQAWRYRFKPAPKRTVKIGYLDSNGDWQQKELVAPETVAPKVGAHVFVLDKHMDIGMPWGHSNCYPEYLDLGYIFLTREDAQATSEWLTECRNGGAK